MQAGEDGGQEHSRISTITADFCVTQQKLRLKYKQKHNFLTEVKFST
jgi:hypothetical protein